MQFIRLCFSAIIAVVIVGLTFGGLPSHSVAQDDPKQSKPAAVKISDEDPEVAAYFKSKGWSLKSDVRISDFKRLNYLNVEKPGNFFEHVELTADDYKMIAKSKSLQVLNLGKVKTTDEGLKSVAGIPQMENIIIDGEGVTNAGMKALAASQSLDTVALSNVKNVTDAGIKELAALPRLQSLILMFCTLDGSAFEAFAGSMTLKSVSLVLVEGFTDVGAGFLAKLPNLTELKISTMSDKSKLTAAGIKAIVDARLPGKFEFDKRLIDDSLLESLLAKGWLYGPTPPGSSDRKPSTPEEVTSIALDDSKVTDKGFEKLLPCVNIRSLHIGRTSIGDETLKKLSGFKKLSYLSLEKTKVTAAGLEAVSGLPIKHLGMEACEMSEDALKAIGKMTSLEELWLRNAKIKGEWLKHISALPKLKELGLAGTDFVDDAAKFVTPLSNLEKLDVQSTQLGDAGFQELVKMPKLRSFYLDGTKLTKEVFQKAKKDHPKMYLQCVGLDR
jgi:Leucine-rich repeat (LRR) protein